jgi:hypothetical protein
VSNLDLDIYLHQSRHDSIDLISAIYAVSSGKCIVTAYCFSGPILDTTRPQEIQDLWNCKTFEYLNNITRYPESWPQQQIVVGQALRRYGLSEQARKISQRYIANVVTTWEKTGLTWERYDAFWRGSQRAS